METLAYILGFALGVLNCWLWMASPSQVRRLKADVENLEADLTDRWEAWAKLRDQIGQPIGGKSPLPYQKTWHLERQHWEDSFNQAQVQLAAAVGEKREAQQAALDAEGKVITLEIKLRNQQVKLNEAMEQRDAAVNGQAVYAMQLSDIAKILHRQH